MQQTEYPINAALTEYLRGRLSDLPALASLTVLDTVDSTNTYLRRLGDQDAAAGTVVLARQQSAGKGRQGRAFFSPPDTGLYLSMLVKPDCAAENILALTPMAAVAAAETVEAVSGEQTQIKWVNDLLLHGKKVCGILCESKFAQNAPKPDYVIVGIGTNLTAPPEGFPPELCEIAGAVFAHCEEPQRLFLQAAETLIRRLFAQYAGLAQKAYLSGYRARLSTVGKDILVMENGIIRQAKALAADDDLRLLVRYADGTEGWRSTGEIRIREQKTE